MSDIGWLKKEITFHNWFQSVIHCGEFKTEMQLVSERRRKKSLILKYALPLIFFEVFLFPMFHIGNIPFKFSLIFIVLYWIIKLPWSSFVVSFLIIIMFSWIGKVFACFFLDQYEIKRTLWFTMNYLVLVLGFLYGVRQSPKNLNWVFPLGILYGAINIAILFLWKSSPFLIKFYHLERRVSEGLFDLRNPGVFTNPNASALGMNLLLLFWVVGKERGLITLRKGYYDVLIFVIGLVANVTFASASGFIAYFLISGIYLFHRFREKFYKGILILFGIAILIFVSNSFLYTQYGAGAYRGGIYLLSTFDKKINRELSRDSAVDGSRIYKIRHAFNTVSLSPLWGVGSDRADSKYLESIQYHNDWSEIMVSSGIIGLMALAYMTWRISRISLVLIIPFVFPGLTNSFLFTAQVAMAYFIFLGIVLKGYHNKGPVREIRKHAR